MMLALFWLACFFVVASAPGSTFLRSDQVETNAMIFSSSSATRGPLAVLKLLRALKLLGVPRLSPSSEYEVGSSAFLVLWRGLRSPSCDCDFDFVNINKVD